jgi:hypothetical protein
VKGTCCAVIRIEKKILKQHVSPWWQDCQRNGNPVCSAAGCTCRASNILTMSVVVIKAASQIPIALTKVAHMLVTYIMIECPYDDIYLPIDLPPSSTEHFFHPTTMFIKGYETLLCDFMLREFTCLKNKSTRKSGAGAKRGPWSSLIIKYYLKLKHDKTSMF